jgi:hypothetical protein
VANDVFLSYSRKDIQLMHRVRASLIQAGLTTVWTDEGIVPGTPLWDAAIEEALQEARCMVVILTPNSKNAKGVRDEIHYANIHSKRIFPLLAAGDVQSSIPYTLSGTQWVDARTNYDEAIRKLVEGIQLFLSRPLTPQKPVQETRSKARRERPVWLTTIGSVGVVIAVSLLILLWANGAFRAPATPEPTLSENEKALTLVADTQVAVILNGFYTETSVANATATAQAYTHTPTSTPTEDFTATANAQATLDAQATANVPTDTPQPTPTSTTAPTSTLTPTITPTPDVGATQTADAVQATAAQENARATQAAITSKEDCSITILQQFAAPGGFAQGITWDGTSIWLADNSGTIFNVSSSNQLLATYSSPEVTPEGLVWTGASFWVFTTNRSELYEFEIVGNEVVTLQNIESPNEVIGGTNDDLAWDGQNLWYADQKNLHYLDTSGNPILSTPLVFDNEIAGMDWDGTQLWIAHNDFPSNANFNIVDPEGNIRATFTSPIFEIDGMSWGNRDNFWAIGRDSLGEAMQVYQLKATCPWWLNIPTLTPTRRSSSDNSFSLWTPIPDYFATNEAIQDMLDSMATINAYEVPTPFRMPGS